MLGFQTGPFGDCGILALLILRTMGVALLLRLFFCSYLSAAMKVCAQNRFRFSGELARRVREIPRERNGSKAVKLAFRRTPRPREVAARVLLMGVSKEGMRRWRAK
jgi:hypothetical protein